jgi:hypothetical protein
LELQTTRLTVFYSYFNDKKPAKCEELLINRVDVCYIMQFKIILKFELIGANLWIPANKSNAIN